MNFEFRQLTKDEERIIKSNVAVYDRLFALSKRRCANPLCDFPLVGLEEGYFSNNAPGRVCNMCHTLENIIASAPGLKAAHEEHKKELARKEKLKKSDNSSSW